MDWETAWGCSGKRVFSFRPSQTAQVQSKGVNVQVQKLGAGHILATGRNKGGFLNMHRLALFPVTGHLLNCCGMTWEKNRELFSQALLCERREQSENCLENKMPHFFNSSYSGGKKQFRKVHCLGDGHK